MVKNSTFLFKEKNGVPFHLKWCSGYNLAPARGRMELLCRKFDLELRDAKLAFAMLKQAAYTGNISHVELLCSLYERH